VSDHDREYFDREYLGDGVYAHFDGYGVWLTTGNHDRRLADNEIYLEPKVLLALRLFTAALGKKRKNAP
jgi:hypothetical protein